MCFEGFVMLVCDPFEIIIEKDINTLFKDIKRIAKLNRIKIEGNKDEGIFNTGVVKGTYNVKGKKIIITVTERPYKVNCDTLKNVLTKFFSGDVSKEYDKIFENMKLFRD